MWLCVLLRTPQTPGRLCWAVPCASRHFLSTYYQHNIIYSGHTCLTCVPACNCHHVHGWAVYGVPGLNYDVIILLKSYTSLLCVNSNSYMYGTWTSKSSRSTLYTCTARRAFKSSLSIVLHYLAQCPLHCTALPLLLQLRDVRHRLPHVFCNWSEVPVICVILLHTFMYGSLRKPMELIQLSYYLLSSVASTEGHAT